MKITFQLLPALAVAALAHRPKPFILPSMTSHQPDGYPGGTTNFYSLSFDIESHNSPDLTTAYCHEFWGDNSYMGDQPAYSTSVPTDTWTTCAVSKEDLGNKATNFRFQLFPYFSIGNLSVLVEEILENGKTLQGFTHITNSTDSYVCEINPRESPMEYPPDGMWQHAHGDCSIAEGKGPFEIRTSWK